MTLEDRLRDQVARVTGRAAASASVVKLKADASNRSYYRVGLPPETFVLMVMPLDSLTKSEELGGGAEASELPFVNVHRYLSSLGIRVPQILRFDEAQGMMVLEDLSDVTFERALESQDRTHLYTRAVELLALLRAKAERAPDAGCLAFQRAFDQSLFDWELHHFREWGLEIWSGRKLSEDDRKELDCAFAAIAAQLAEAPRGFTHRDYQSRNLMMKEGELVVIDFQDALQGPRQYDLVALLRDSYVELSREFVVTMVERYIAAFERHSGERIDRASFLALFDLLTVQRKLKDAGRFEYIHRVKGNSGFLTSIPASLRYVREALEVQPALRGLQRLLGKYVPELAAR